jgi:hypothetical protein
MFDKSLHDFCSEFYILEKSIEVEVLLENERVRIKIDALKNERTGEYRTKAYREEHFSLQPTYPQAVGPDDRQVEDFRIWVGYDQPFLQSRRESVDAVLRQALGSLKEKCSA